MTSWQNIVVGRGDCPTPSPHFAGTHALNEYFPRGGGYQNSQKCYFLKNPYLDVMFQANFQ